VIAQRIEAVPTSITAFIGRARRGPMNRAVPVASLAEFTRAFGSLDPRFPLSGAMRDFFAHGGRRAVVVRGRGDRSRAIEAVDRVELFNLLCILPDRADGNVPPAVWQSALRCCVRRRAMLLVDAPVEWTDPHIALQNVAGLAIAGEEARNAALYFPRASDGRVPCGMVAGVFARIDAARGVWKAPAGIEAAVDATALNAAGINALRPLPGSGTVIWGARTMRVREAPGDEFQYVAIRRFSMFLEESIDRGVKWDVYEPEEARREVERLLNGLWRQGALIGQTPEDAYLVQSDIDDGRLNVTVGFAPLRPAEFIILRVWRPCGER
jgi:hypothetical protein